MLFTNFIFYTKGSVYLIHEDRPAPGWVAFLVPLKDGILREDVSLVQQEDDLVERLEEVHVVVAKLLKKLK